MVALRGFYFCLEINLGIIPNYALMVNDFGVCFVYEFAGDYCEF